MPSITLTEPFYISIISQFIFIKTSCSTGIVCRLSDSHAVLHYITFSCVFLLLFSFRLCGARKTGIVNAEGGGYETYRYITIFKCFVRTCLRLCVSWSRVYVHTYTSKGYYGWLFIVLVFGVF